MDRAARPPQRHTKPPATPPQKTTRAPQYTANKVHLQVDTPLASRISISATWELLGRATLSASETRLRQRILMVRRIPLRRPLLSPALMEQPLRTVSPFL